MRTSELLRLACTLESAAKNEEVGFITHSWDNGPKKKYTRYEIPQLIDEVLKMVKDQA